MEDTSNRSIDSRVLESSLRFITELAKRQRAADGSMAHDIRSALTAVAGNNDLIALSSSNADIRRLAGNSVLASSRIVEMVEVLIGRHNAGLVGAELYGLSGQGVAGLISGFSTDVVEVSTPDSQVVELDLRLLEHLLRLILAAVRSPATLEAPIQVAVNGSLSVRFPVGDADLPSDDVTEALNLRGWSLRSDQADHCLVLTIDG